MSRRTPNRTRALALHALFLFSFGGAVAQPPPLGKTTATDTSAAIGGARARPDGNPVIASVDGHLIHLGDLGQASETLPDNLRTLPFDTLYPVLLERMVDHEALVMMARRQHLDEDPRVRQDIDAAVERVLEAAYLGREAKAKVTDAALRARYNQEFANRPATEEVRARHILVATEAQAQDVLAQLRKGADFATLARSMSLDPDRERGGDLGFFRREQVWPTFADLAFSLSPGQIGQTPIQNEFGWHVIKVQERRLVAPPSFDDVKETLRRELTAQIVRQAIKQARSDLPIHRFNLDGSEIDAASRLDTPAPR